MIMREKESMQVLATDDNAKKGVNTVLATDNHAVFVDFNKLEKLI